MPYKTRHGSHYHMTEGCHGATIPCDTSGLVPCSDCCGGNSGTVLGGSHAGAPGSAMPADSSQGDLGTNPSSDGASASPSHRLKEIVEMADASESSLSGGQTMPPHVAISPSDLAAMTDDGTPIEGSDYEGRGQGWPVKKRGQRFYAPGGTGYAYLTRKQAGIVYAAAKRGDVTMDASHSKEMYGIVGIPWSDLDVHDRQVCLLLSEAIDHIFAGRHTLAQACLDGKKVESKRVSVGRRKVVVTDDNWIDFAFDLEHDYEVGDVAEEEVFQDVWVISDAKWSEPLERRGRRR